MKKIVLCCAAGMSTSMLVQRTLSELQTRGDRAVGNAGRHL